MEPAHVIPVLENRRLLLGVTGSIAAYKAADLASKLTQAGALVDAILTEAARKFVTPLTFQSVTGRQAYTDADLWGRDAHVMHIGLGHAAELLVIAPVTANTIAKLAHGAADSLLTVTALAAKCPVLIAPAMDAGMFDHPATQANLGVLRERGVTVVGPVEGRMASGLVGLGRMTEPEEIVGHTRLILGRTGALRGRKIVVTAGGTQEPLDPVRAIVNRSSGKQGFALAQAALDHGAAVTLVAGPTQLPAPVGARLIDVQTAYEMHQAVVEAIDDADALLMAAAVADFRPSGQSPHKIRRTKGAFELRLDPTEDILAGVSARRASRGRPLIVVGFAAESQDLLANARAKLQAKKLALIVANDITAVGAGFGVDTNRVTLLDADGGVQELPLMSKAMVAEAVLKRLEALLE